MRGLVTGAAGFIGSSLAEHLIERGWVVRGVDCLTASIDGRSFNVFGDGTQVRDFTYVGDVVDATRRAAGATVEPGTIVNVAGDSSTRLLDVIEVVGEVAGRPLDIEWLPSEPGDVFQTGGDVTLARRLLGWSPQLSLRDGIAAQFAWQHARRTADSES